MKNCIYILFFVLLNTFQQSAYAQDSVIDSLNLALKQAKDDTTQITILSQLSDLCLIEQIPIYADKSLALCKAGLSRSSGALKIFYQKNMANALNNKGIVAHQHGDIPTAIKFYNEGLRIQESIKDKKGISYSLNNLGVIYYNQGDVEKALDCYYKSLIINEQIKDKNGISFSYYNLAFVYQNQGDLNKALEFYSKSLKLRREINSKADIAATINNIGLVYKKQAETIHHKDSLAVRQKLMDKALGYFNESLAMLEQIGDKNSIAFSLSGIGVVYSSQAEALFPKDEVKRKFLIDQAIGYYKRSLKLQEDMNDQMGIFYSLSNISSAMFQLGEVNESEKLAKQSLDIAKKLNFPENINRAASVLKEIYRKQNMFKEAFEMYSLEIQMRDSMNNEQNRKSSIKKQFQYEYEKQAAADSVKHTEEQKVKNAQLEAQAASLKQEKTQRYALYGGLLLVIGFSGFVFNRFRVTQKQKKIIEEQKVLVDSAYESLHEKNKEVMDSITYARRIQRALLTPEIFIDRALNKLQNKS